MAFSNPYQGITLPSIQKPTSEDYLAPQRATKELITSVDAHLKKVDTEKADRATAALMEAHNTGDIGYINSIMDYAVNNITDLDKRNTLINSGRGAIETTKLNEYNYGLSEAQKTSNLDAFNALVNSAKVDPNISQANKLALYQTAQTALPQIQQAVDTKQLLGDYTAAQTLDSKSLLDAIGKAKLNPEESNLFEQTPDGYLSPKVLDPSQFSGGGQGAYGQALAAQNAAIAKLGGFIKTANDTPADASKVLQNYITKAVAEGKSPTTIQAAIASFQALHPNMEAVTPTESAQYTAQAAKLDEQATIAKKANQERKSFAEELLRSTISKSADIPDDKLLDAVNTVTTDWLNINGDSQKTAKQLLLSVKANPSTYGLTKQPTNNEIVLAAQASVSGGFWGDTVFKKGEFVNILQSLINTRAIDPKQVQSVLTQQFNDIVSNAATAEQDINTNVNYSKLRLKAGFGDTSAYRQLFDAIQRVGVSNTPSPSTNNVSTSATANNPTEGLATSGTASPGTPSAVTNPTDLEKVIYGLVGIKDVSKQTPATKNTYKLIADSVSKSGLKQQDAVSYLTMLGMENNFRQFDARDTKKIATSTVGGKTYRGIAQIGIDAVTDIVSNKEIGGQFYNDYSQKKTLVDKAAYIEQLIASPTSNVELGALYYKTLLTKAEGDPIVAAAYYNAGPNSKDVEKAITYAKSKADPVKNTKAFQTALTDSNSGMPLKANNYIRGLLKLPPLAEPTTTKEKVSDETARQGEQNLKSVAPRVSKVTGGLGSTDKFGKFIPSVGKSTDTSVLQPSNRKEAESAPPKNIKPLQAAIEKVTGKPKEPVVSALDINSPELRVWIDYTNKLQELSKLPRLTPAQKKEQDSLAKARLAEQLRLTTLAKTKGVKLMYPNMRELNKLKGAK